MSHTIYNLSTGEVLRVYRGPLNYLNDQVQDGEGVMEGLGNTKTHRVIDGVLVEMDTRSLEEVRSQQWDLIKRKRAEEDYSPLTVGSFTLDANQESQQKIAGAVQLAVLAGPSFTIDWTMTDNTVQTLTQAQVISIGVALGQRTGQIYAKARLRRNEIDAAETVEEVQAVQWV